MPFLFLFVPLIHFSFLPFTSFLASSIPFSLFAVNLIFFNLPFKFFPPLHSFPLSSPSSSSPFPYLLLFPSSFFIFNFIFLLLLYIFIILFLHSFLFPPFTSFLSFISPFRFQFNFLHLPPFYFYLSSTFISSSSLHPLSPSFPLFYLSIFHSLLFTFIPFPFTCLLSHLSSSVSSSSYLLIFTAVFLSLFHLLHLSMHLLFPSLSFSFFLFSTIVFPLHLLPLVSRLHLPYFINLFLALSS